MVAQPRCPGPQVRSLRLRSMCAVVLAVVCASCSASADTPAAIWDSFTGADGLIASEDHPVADGSPWTMTSGSLFRQGNEGWTGQPDGGGRDGATGSAVFRMVSNERSFADVDVTMRLRVDDLVETDRTPAQDFDGAHLWLRYESEWQLYAVSVDRRDGEMVIKKKCPGGDSNGGTYFDLGSVVTGVAIPLGRWQHVAATIRDLPDGAVAITADRDGTRVEAVDRGVGCAPLRGAGGVGLRGDNADLHFDDIAVDSATPAT